MSELPISDPFSQAETAPQQSTTQQQYIHQYFPPKQKQVMGSVAQVALLLGLTGAGLIFGSVVSLLVFKLMTGAGLMGMQKAMENPSNAQAIKVVQVVSTFFAFLVPAFSFSYIVHGNIFKHLRFKSPASGKQIALVFFIAFTALYVSGALAAVNEMIPIPKNWENSFKQLEDTYNKQVLVIAQMNNWKDFVLSLGIIALAPAIFEELLFRGVLQQLLQSWFKNAFWAIIITSILFSLIHLSYYGFLSRTALGIILGLLFYYSNNIWTCILAHFLNNGIAVAQLYVLSMKGKLSKEAMDDKFPVWIGVVAIITLLGLLYLYKKESEKPISV